MKGTNLIENMVAKLSKKKSSKQKLWVCSQKRIPIQNCDMLFVKKNEDMDTAKTWKKI